MHFTCSVLRLAVHWRLPFTLENPARSLLWLCPPVRWLLRRTPVQFATVELCAFGTAWRKSTGVLGTWVNLDALYPYRCRCPRRGPCSFSGRPHVPLLTQTPGGTWLTRLAKPYPWKFVRVLAQAFHATELSKIALEFGRHLDM